MRRRRLLVNRRITVISGWTEGTSRHFLPWVTVTTHWPAISFLLSMLPPFSSFLFVSFHAFTFSQFLSPFCTSLAPCISFFLYFVSLLFHSSSISSISQSFFLLPLPFRCFLFFLYPFSFFSVNLLSVSVSFFPLFFSLFMLPFLLFLLFAPIIKPSPFPCNFPPFLLFTKCKNQAFIYPLSNLLQ